MTNPEWEKEVNGALKGTGWTVFSAGCAQASPICFADLTKGGDSKQIKLSRQEFSTVEARKAEILRQVQNT